MVKVELPPFYQIARFISSRLKIIPSFLREKYCEGLLNKDEMSLYYEAAPLLAQGQPGSLKSRVFGSKLNKSSPTQIFALISEASKWSAVLKEVVENSGLLQAERKVSLMSHILTPVSKPMLTNMKGFP